MLKFPQGRETMFHSIDQCLLAVECQMIASTQSSWTINQQQFKFPCLLAKDSNVKRGKKRIKGFMGLALAFLFFFNNYHLITNTTHHSHQSKQNRDIIDQCQTELMQNKKEPIFRVDGFVQGYFGNIEFNIFVRKRFFIWSILR